MAATINPNKTLAQMQQETRARNDRSIFQRVTEKVIAEHKQRDERQQPKQ
jgi:hypothetical protein